MKKRKQRQPTTTASIPGDARSNLPLVAVLALLVSITVVAYLPALQGEFIWDDDYHVTKPALRSLSGLWRIWFDLGSTQQYYPLLHSAFWLQYQLWGENTLGYHLVNVLLHATAAWLVYVILQRLKVPGALLAAAIFAVHPVHVESVAWITELKNTLSAVFYLSAMLVYLKFDETRQRSFYGLALGLFVLGLLSKTVTATLPAALLVIFWWKRGTLSWRRDVVPLIPFFVLGAIAGLLTAWVEKNLIGAEGADFELSLLQRGLLAGRVIWFYLAKLVWPANLIFIYPRWEVDPTVWWQWLFPVATLGVLGALWAIRKRWRAPLAGFLFFAGTLFPVLGFLNVYPFRFSFVADHFQYLASLGIITLIAAGITLALARWGQGRFWLKAGVSVALVGTLLVLSARQSRMYTDIVSLYQTTIERNPKCWMAYYNLGFALASHNHLEQAIGYYEQALEVRPDYAEAHNNLGVTLARLGQPQEAIDHYEQALRIKPQYAEAHNNLGVKLAELGHVQEAIEHYEQAIQIDPDDTSAQTNLAVEFAETGRLDEAIERFQQVLRIDPDDALAHNNLGITLSRTGRTQEAMDHYREALRIKPDYADAHNNLGVKLLELGRAQEAIEHYRQALRISPNYAEVHHNLGNAYRSINRTQEAIEHFQHALRVKPDYGDAHRGLGSLLAAAGRFDEAIAHYRQALGSMPGNVAARAELAVVLAKTNQPTEAIAVAEEAVRLARSQGQTELAEQVDMWLTNYRAGLSNSPDSEQPPNSSPVSP